MGNGIWVAGIALTVLMGIGVSFPLAAVVSWPIMFFSGRYFARLSEDWQKHSYQIKRQAWKERERRENGKRSDH